MTKGAADTLAYIARDAALRNAVIDAALDCIIMMDQHGNIVEFNPASEATFGYSREEAVGARLSDLLIPEDLRSAHANGMKRYLATGEANVLGRRIEVPAINKAGESLLVELAISPVEFDGTKFFSAYLRDITSAKAAEDKLRSSEARYQSLFEMSADAIIVHDETGIILDANTSACEMLGLDKTDLLSRRVPELHPPEHRDIAHQALKEASLTGRIRMEIDFLHSRGHRIPTEVVARRVETEDGAQVHGVVRDISVRVAAEQQLVRAKEAAEQANDAKSDFLANMSHEMRTPLNGIIGSLSLIENRDISGENEKLVSAAARSAETLLTLIDDLLDLSRIEAGEIDLEISTSDPQDLVTIIQEVFGASARKKSLALNTRVTMPPGYIRIDAGKVRQVLLNLVGNAIKFTQRGHVDISIALSKKGAWDTMTVQVADTGIGISEADLQILFDRFKQVDSSHSKSHGGAGLGLAISRELVEIMGGDMSVESTPGVGTVFTFTVPITRVRPPSQREVLEDSARPLLSGRVLIAEDSETNAMVAKAMLDKLGLEYVHVSDGAAAVDAALNDSFHAILMDVSMPTMDGLEATRILRERGIETPIIAMTAHALKGDRDKAFAEGMTGYLTKPIRQTALRKVLSHWVAGSDQEPKASPTGLDYSAIDALWAGNEDTYGKIARIFLDELAWRIPSLDASKLSDSQAHAHSIKGAAANIGATSLSGLAAQLEAAAGHQDAPQCRRLIDLIRKEASQVKRALEADYLEVPEDG